MAGRQMVPDALKLLRGTSKKARVTARRVSKPTGAIPSCPTWIDPRAQQVWKELAAECHAAGILSSLDTLSFASLCNAVSRLETANAAIEADGLFIDTPKGLTKHPGFLVSKDCWAVIKQISQEFGLTPVSRQRVHLTAPNKTPSPLEKLLHQKR